MGAIAEQRKSTRVVAAVSVVEVMKASGKGCLKRCESDKDRRVVWADQMGRTLSTTSLVDLAMADQAESVTDEEECDSPQPWGNKKAGTYGRYSYSAARTQEEYCSECIVL